ncbi:hypothetical protein NE235_26150 [Actinoallomurus spadix]|uniref:hypothetical protein n=1 Tax=Actinoallomurus spadix TaxID=79912 RepID=UPI002093D16E|nr:hypothetical protein [Actinoallomurus spadix]MCO5989597.1 hypothetical protein [Actinoallomurus spadix]
MDFDEEYSGASLLVPAAGSLVVTGDRWEPYRLFDGSGAVVEAVTSFFRDLQAAGRSPATVRSYGLDLLRWFRFLRSLRHTGAFHFDRQGVVVVVPESSNGDDEEFGHARDDPPTLVPCLATV